MDVGVAINQYLIVEHIGRGGMADVWSARDQKLNRMVAIKTIAQSLSGDSDPVGMFKQEAQIIAKMEHPHILPIYDFGEYDGQLYIVMRYVAGGSLEDLLRRGPLPITETLRLGQAIAQALDFAHQNKVIHLDLKPPNVLLDSHQSPYLADFGLATALNPEGKAQNPGAGTLLYMAPEQLTAETIDHRADIYSFCIVMYHMLTGTMPFDSVTPLALRQMQFREDLPDPDFVNPTLPPYLGDILRRGTALDPDDRPQSLEVLVEEMRSVTSDSVVFSAGMGQTEDSLSMGQDMLFDGTNMEILEAVDIYSRARHNWAAGNGRFLLGVTHFMLMNGYYMNAEEHGLELDIEGAQMLLRGALEYDHAVTYWWKRLDDDNRRWVCLHALRSGNAPARVRALYRLETIPDAETPQIPRLVAQALQIETNEEARIAALQVLGTRAKLMKPKQKYDIKTEFRGKMLTSFTRLGVQINPQHEWVDVVYSNEIDTLLAETALDRGMPKVAAFAARIIGRIRSKAAVQRIAEQQAEGRRGALRALALIRDEAPNLPPIVNAQGRLYAWATNTLLRMIDQPLYLISRFFTALIGGWLAMGMTIWITYRSEAIFTPQRWGNTLAVGLMFGVFIALLVVVADEFSARLRGFWPWWVRLLVSAGLGFWIASLTWAQYTWLYMQLDIMWNVMRFGGFGLMLGFVLTALFHLRSYIAIPLTAFFAYIPIYVTFEMGWMYKKVWLFSELSKMEIPAFWKNTPFQPFNFQGALIYYDFERQIYSLAIPFVLLVAVGGHFPHLVRDLAGFIRFLRKRYAPSLSSDATDAAMPVAAPILAAAHPPHLAADPGSLKTEMDVSQGERIVPDKRYPATEVDPQREQWGTDPDEAPPQDNSQRVDRGTGIRIDDSIPRTELDPNQRPRTGDNPPPGSQRINKGTGIRIDDPNMKTEFDPHKKHDDE